MENVDNFDYDYKKWDNSSDKKKLEDKVFDITGEINLQYKRIIQKKDLIAKIPIARKNLYGISIMLEQLKRILEYSDNIKSEYTIDFYNSILDQIIELTKYNEEKIETLRNKIINHKEN